MNKRLWYKEKAEEWVEALPLGNGSLGAMVLGNVFKERIALNEDTLWTGTPKDKINYEARNYLEKARNLIEKEKYFEAQRLMNEKMLAGYTESYAPLGDLNLEFIYNELDDDKSNVINNNENIKAENNRTYKDYIRELNLEDATTRISYKIKETTFEREVFISKPNNVMVVKITSSKEKNINLKGSLSSLLKSKTYEEEKDSIVLSGITPIEMLPSYVEDNSIIYDEEEKLGTKFKVKLKAKILDGSISVNKDVLEVKNATEVILILAASTNFESFDKAPSKSNYKLNECNLNVENAYKLSYKELYDKHIEEYRELFSRVEFNLGNDEKDDIPTNERLQRLKEGEEDLSLISLYFQYGRYLLISSSRKGSQPANLQGIWNEDLRPAWSSNYTININTEMNYWPAEVCNLSECHEPLFNMIKDLSISGKKTAKEQFNCKGWLANHNVDIWRYSSTVAGSSEWGFWPMGGAWLCQHLWEHYDFTRDENFLKEAYPLMKNAAIFLLDWFKEDEEGMLNSCPSTSPENNFLDKEGRPCCASKSSTMDIAITRDLFKNCIKSAAILNIDKDFIEKLNNAISKLPSYKINKHDGIQEWYKDFQEKEPGHRHISHLFGLYPGKEIIENDTKDLYKAAKNTLERRLSQGGGHTGWSCTWIINCYARLKEAELANKYLNILLSKLTYSNLFCVHPPFQIDGNFGGTAGIAEMLIQSHQGYIELLPAIPKTWKDGEVKGLKARGGYTVDIKWRHGKLIYAKIKSDYDNVCSVHYKKSLKSDVKNEVIIFEIKKDSSYTIVEV